MKKSQRTFSADLIIKFQKQQPRILFGNYYDAALARLVTADTVVDGEYSVSGWNRYMYCAGNPVLYKDPSGHTQEQYDHKQLFSGPTDYLDNVDDSLHEIRMAQAMHPDSERGVKDGIVSKVKESVCDIVSFALTGPQPLMPAKVTTLNSYLKDAAGCGPKKGQSERYYGGYDNGHGGMGALENYFAVAALARWAGKSLTQKSTSNFVSKSTKQGATASSYVDDAGNVLDLNKFKNLEKVKTPIKVNRSGSNIPLNGKPNSVVSTTGGHKVIYDSNSRALYDVSSKRIKIFEWHKSPDGRWFPRQGRDTKMFKNQVPKDLLDLLE